MCCQETDNTKDIKELYIEFPNLNLEMEYSKPLSNLFLRDLASRGYFLFFCGVNNFRYFDKGGCNIFMQIYLSEFSSFKSSKSSVSIYFSYS